MSGWHLTKIDLLVFNKDPSSVLDRLDGLAKARKSGNTIKEWLQLSDDELSEYKVSRPDSSGKKRVS